MLLAGLCFYPTLAAGLTGADAYLQHANAIAGYERISPVDVYAKLAAHYPTLAPGWFPLAPVPLAIWLFDPPQRIVKVVELLLLLLNFATFAIVARRIFASTSAAVLAVAIALAIWQLRQPHDPVLGTSFLMPCLAEFVLLAYASWLTYRTSGKTIWLVCSYGAVVAAVLTGFAGWMLCAVLVALALRDAERRRAAFGIAAALIVTAVISAIFASPFAAFTRPSYAGDFLAELIAPLPATFRSFGYLPIDRIAGLWHGSRYVDDRFTKIPAVHGWQWLWLVVSAATALFALERSPRARGEQLAPALFFGFGFWLAPALVLGPPDVWHGGLPLGQAFDIVYFQYLGVATLVTTGLLSLRRTQGSAAFAAPSLCALSVFFLCYGNTRADAVTIERTVRYEGPRDLVQRASSAGFFARLPRGMTLAVAPNEPFANGIHSDVSDAKYAFYHYSGRRFAVVSTNSLPSLHSGNVWIFKTSGSSGYLVTLAHYAGVRNGTKLTDRSYAFSVFPTVRAALDAPQPGLRVRLTNLHDGFFIDAQRRCGPVALERAFAAQYPSIVWGDGFYPTGPSGQHHVEPHVFDGTTFMAKSASFVLQPSPCAHLPIVFNTIVTAAGKGWLHARAGPVRAQLGLTAASLPFSLTVDNRGTPVEVRLTTDAPIADLNPVNFRYDADRPQNLRLRLGSSFATVDAAQRFSDPFSVAPR